MAAGALTRRAAGALTGRAARAPRFAPLAALAAALLITQPLAAQDLPATFGVTGVASRDVLNVRAAPAVAAPILDTLAPDAAGVEVLGFSDDGAWARVPLPEGEGWVARRYLAEEPRGTGFPAPLRCLGTEPFWAVSLDEDGRATLETPDEPARRLRPLGDVSGFTGSVAAFDAGGETMDLTVVRQACSDGMSDRPYGLYAMVWDRGETLLEGCCTLQP